jgi:methylated-DNA-[protein]-cysteine S-methyltransferase
VVADPEGVVVASGFCESDALVARLAPQEQDRVEPVRELGRVSEAMAAYLDGRAASLDDVSVRQSGGPFQQQVWEVMRHIPSGQTWSYAELAVKSGRPTATRAVGTACARNLVAPFVPCHRVLRSDGTLGGYYYGLDVKRWLLELERAS